MNLKEEINIFIINFYTVIGILGGIEIILKSETMLSYLFGSVIFCTGLFLLNTIIRKVLDAVLQILNQTFLDK